MLNAIHDALRPHGVTSIDFPLTPNRVWQAIEDARNQTRTVTGSSGESS
jgi:carbon-monoxide dehydrogenase large subunit